MFLSLVINNSSTAYKPEVKANFTKITISEEQTVTLPCEIDGKPAPVVYWKRGGQKLEGPRYQQMVTGNLTIVVSISNPKNCSRLFFSIHQLSLDQWSLRLLEVLMISCAQRPRSHW